MKVTMKSTVKYENDPALVKRYGITWLELKEGSNVIVENELGEYLIATGAAEPYTEPAETKFSKLLDDKGQPIAYQSNEKKSKK